MILFELGQFFDDCGEEGKVKSILWLCFSTAHDTVNRESRLLATKTLILDV